MDLKGCFYVYMKNTNNCKHCVTSVIQWAMQTCQPPKVKKCVTLNLELRKVVRSG